MTVSGKTCVFEKDNDPTLLRSTSAGKLLKFVIDDGEHVHAGQVRMPSELPFFIYIYARASIIFSLNMSPPPYLFPLFVLLFV